MSDDAALLAAIRADPEDDAPRLVYADWLDEHGQAAWADHIREAITNRETLRSVCLRRTRTRPAQQYWGRYNGPAADARVLYPLLGQTLPDANTWSDPEEAPRTSVRFRRGFAESLTCSAVDWIAHADALARAHPVRDVTLTTWPEWEDPTAGPNGSVRLTGRVAWWGWDELSRPDRARAEDVPLALLCAEWPGVRSWFLPPVATEPWWDGVGVIRRDGRVHRFTSAHEAAGFGVQAFSPTLQQRMGR